MSVTRVYVGEPGGENLDVLKANTNEETKGRARFERGDVITVPKDLAERLDRSWATEGDAKKQGVEGEAKQTKNSEESQDEATSEEGDSQ